MSQSCEIFALENIPSELNFIVLQVAVQCVANLMKEKKKSKRRRI
jgi:hypothetical protein